LGGWQALLLQSSDIIVYPTISHYKPLVEAVAAPAGLHHQWVGEGSNVDSMVVTGYGTMARAQWHMHWHGGLMEQWHGHNGAGTMTQAQWPWHRHIGTGTMAQPWAREQLQDTDFISTDWEDGEHWPCGAVILLFTQQSATTSHW